MNFSMSTNFCSICESPSSKDGQCLEALAQLNLTFIKQRFRSQFPFFLGRDLSTVTRDNCCDDCCQIVQEISRHVKLVRETEKKIETFLKTLDGKFQSGGKAAALSPVVVTEIDLKSEEGNQINMDQILPVGEDVVDPETFRSEQCEHESSEDVDARKLRKRKHPFERDEEAMLTADKWKMKSQQNPKGRAIENYSRPNKKNSGFGKSYQDPDPTTLKGLTEVNGVKYYLNYAFEKAGNQLVCGFPHCLFKTNTTCEDLLDSSVMEHILQAHPLQKPKKPKTTTDSYSCEICPSEPPLKGVVELRKHFKSVHRHLYRPDDPRFYDGACATCEKPFTSVTDLKLHEFTHYNSKEIAALAAQGFHPPKPRSNSKPQLFKCTNCPKTFATKQNCNLHIAARHFKPGEAPKFTCKFCGKECTTKRGITLHTQRYHDPDKLMGKWRLCSECGKKFLIKTELEKHFARAHGGHKRFQCEKCGHAFAEKSDLSRHMTSHMPKEFRPFSCKLCGETYRYDKNLYRHIEKAHGREHLPVSERRVIGCKQMYPCPICEKVFEDRAKMRKHRGAMHRDGAEKTRKKCKKVGTSRAIPSLSNTAMYEQYQHQPSIGLSEYYPGIQQMLGFGHSSHS